MDKIMNDYLDKINRYLKSIPALERVDIINEIKSQMLELQAQDELSAAQILERLGSPEELAKAYLGQAITKTNTFSWRKLSAVTAFYSLAGFTGVFILPFLSICAVAFMLSGIIAPIAGIIKLFGSLVGVDVPFVVFQIGDYTAPAYLAFPYSVIMGVLLFVAGKGLWKLMISYIRKISQTKEKLQMM